MNPEAPAGTFAAVVICGGFGTRLGTALGTAPCKSLLQILGVPALAYALEALKQADCQQCILSIDRDEIASDIGQIGKDSGLPCTIHRDSGRGPTATAQEASAVVPSHRFVVLYGHQLVFPEHLTQMVATNNDFVATTYAGSSEGVRKIATLNAEGYCLKIRRGGANSPPNQREVYIDKPYLLATEPIRRSLELSSPYHPSTPADESLRAHTILRYAHDLYTIPAAFRHEFHYEEELAEVAAQAHRFSQSYQVRWRQ